MGRHHLDEIDPVGGTWLPGYKRAERGWWYRGKRRMAKGRLSVDDLVRDNPQQWRLVLAAGEPSTLTSKRMITVPSTQDLQIRYSPWTGPDTFLRKKDDA